MNLTGRWKGKYIYGDGYPRAVIGKAAPFEIDITDNDGIITGVCLDEVVESIDGNESTIEGTFNENFLTFIKRYKVQLAMDDLGNHIPLVDQSNNSIQYVGHMRKRLLSKKHYFEGEWQITSDFKDDSSKVYTYSVEGTWTMSKE